MDQSKKRRPEDAGGARGRPSRSAAATSNDPKRSNSLSLVHNTANNTVSACAEDPTELYCVCRQP